MLIQKHASTIMPPACLTATLKSMRFKFSKASMLCMTVKYKMTVTIENFRMDFPSSMRALMPKILANPLKGLSLPKLGINSLAEKINPPVKPVDNIAKTASVIMMGKMITYPSSTLCAKIAGSNSALSMTLRSNCN